MALPVNGNDPLGVSATVTPSDTVVGEVEATLEPSVLTVGGCVVVVVEPTDVLVTSPIVVVGASVVVVVASVVVVVGAWVVVVVGASVVVVVGASVVVVVGASVVVVVGASVVVVVGASVVVVVGASVVVVVGASVVVVVVGASVVVVVVCGAQSSCNVTDVVFVAVTPSLQEPVTDSVTVPRVPAGIVVVAVVVPLGPTLVEYPVTANDCAPIVAVALVMCIVRFVSLLPIDHVMTCAPSEHVASPDTIGWCANAGSAVKTTNNATRPMTAPRAVTRRRVAPIGNPRADLFTLPPSKAFLPTAPLPDGAPRCHAA